jgi:hypothetical protein
MCLKRRLLFEMCLPFFPSNSQSKINRIIMDEFLKPWRVFEPAIFCSNSDHHSASILWNVNNSLTSEKNPEILHPSGIRTHDLTFGISFQVQQHLHLPQHLCRHLRHDLRVRQGQLWQLEPHHGWPARRRKQRVKILFLVINIYSTKNRVTRIYFCRYFDPFRSSPH